MAGYQPGSYRHIQQTLNWFFAKYLKGYGPLLVDGIAGHETRKYIKLSKYYMGYVHIDGGADIDWHKRLHHPNTWGRGPSAVKTIRRGIQRRHAHNDAWDRAHQRKPPAPAPSNLGASGVTTFDGRYVARWMVPYLQWARAHGWRGTLTSGWRDPVYSEHLCYVMCGRPSCPGRCAGRSSNHSGSTPWHGAVDVSDYYTFGNLMRQCPYSPHIFNALGSRDPVHFSATGN